MNGGRRIIVLCEEFPEDKQVEFVTWLQNHGAGWAHWFAGGWLIAAPTAVPDVNEITRKLRELVPTLQCVVVEVSKPSAWQGYLNVPLLNAARNWLRSQWGL